MTGCQRSDRRDDLADDLQIEVLRQPFAVDGNLLSHCRWIAEADQLFAVDVLALLQGVLHEVGEELVCLCAERLDGGQVGIDSGSHVVDLGESWVSAWYSFVDQVLLGLVKVGAHALDGSIPDHAALMRAGVVEPNASVPAAAHLEDRLVGEVVAPVFPVGALPVAPHADGNVLAGRQINGCVAPKGFDDDVLFAREFE